MKALFVIKHPGAIRNLESVLAELELRGHTAHLAFESLSPPHAADHLVRFVRNHPGLTWSKLPETKSYRWVALAEAVRIGLDYLRYLEPRYADASKLRARARAATPPSLAAMANVAARSRLSLRLFRFALAAVERLMPPPPPVFRLIAEQDPDVVLVTPLVGFASRQADYLRAARATGRWTAFPVLSWDNLTNKGLLRDVPDRVFVWNESQAAEAVELQGVPREQVAVSGAAAYDHWFDWTPSASRDEFCRRVGLNPEKPFVLYVCSSPFIAEDEPSFVAGWLEALRASEEPGLHDLGVLIRPHPQNAASWERSHLAGGDQVAIWPARGEDPLSGEEKSRYFDSIHHSAGVVGVNTSALIEAGIVGRSVYTLLAREFDETQGGTLHFHYLARPEAGLLQTATTFEEHFAQLATGLTRDGSSARSAEFVADFVRPHGRDRPATPIVVDELERLVAEPAPEPRSDPAWNRAMRHLLWPADRYARRARRRMKQQAGGLAEAGESAVKKARNAVSALAGSSGDQILAGPWLAEVGYELLYWIPFLRWATQRHPSLRDRLVVISRGGAASWYAGLCTQYVDLYDLVEPDRLQELVGEVASETGGYRKQLVRTSLDDHLLSTVADSLGLKAPPVLHPETMFTAYRQLAKQSALHRRDTIFAFEPLSAPSPESMGVAVPEGDFVAARFYFNASFPDLPENRAFVAETLAALSKVTDVVLLNPGMRIDDHVDAELAATSRLHRLDDLMTARNNLALQTAVVARARAFVGTYGGLSYLPPLLGVPTVAFYSDSDHFRPQHLETAQRAFRAPPFGRYLAVDTAHAELLSLLFGSERAAFAR